VESTKDFVLSAVAQACNVGRDTLHDASTLTDIGMTSLSVSSLVALIEARYDIRLGNDAITGLYEAPSLRELVALVDRQRPARHRE
jgi:acyl carrier protein